MQIKSQLNSNPSRRWDSPPTPKLESATTSRRDLSDAFVRSDQRTPGLGSLALLGLGAAAVITTVVQAQPAAAQEIDLARDEVRSVEVALRNSSKLLGGARLTGQVGTHNNSLETSTTLLGRERITGSWNGESVDIALKSRLLGGYDVEGRWGDNQVDLDITPVWGNYRVQGSWGADRINAEFDQDFHGNFDVDGSWRGNDIDLNFQTGFFKHDVSGSYGGGKIDLEVSSRSLGSYSIRGESPEDAVFPFLLSNRLSEIRAESQSD